jgi:hypothetical protein
MNLAGVTAQRGVLRMNSCRHCLIDVRLMPAAGTPSLHLLGMSCHDQCFALEAVIPLQWINESKALTQKINAFGSCTDTKALIKAGQLQHQANRNKCKQWKSGEKLLHFCFLARAQDQQLSEPKPPSHLCTASSSELATASSNPSAAVTIKRCSMGSCARISITLDTVYAHNSAPNPRIVFSAAAAMLPVAVGALGSTVKNREDMYELTWRSTVRNARKELKDTNPTNSKVMY